MTEQRSNPKAPSDFLWDVHKYTNDYIRFADTKAAFTAGAATGLVGALIGSSICDSLFKVRWCHWSTLQWTGLVGMLLVLLSLILSIAAIRPRLWTTKHGSGFIFWESILEHGSARHFTTSVHHLTEREQSEAVSNHLFDLAAIAKRKYLYVNRAIWSGTIGGVLIGVVLFLQHAYR